MTYTSEFIATESFIDWCDSMYIADESAGDIVNRIRTTILNLIHRIQRWIKSLFRKTKDKKVQNDLKKASDNMNKAESGVKDCDNPETLKKYEEIIKKQEKELAKAQKEMEKEREEFVKGYHERHEKLNKALKSYVDEVNKPLSWETEDTDKDGKAVKVESPNKINFDELDKMLDALLED